MSKMRRAAVRTSSKVGARIAPGAGLSWEDAIILTGFSNFGARFSMKTAMASGVRSCQTFV
jgi:hypothetical protein